MYQIYNEGILGDVRGRNIIIASEQKDHFGSSSDRLEVDSEFESIDLALRTMQDIEPVPAILSINEFVRLRNRSRSI